MIYSHDMSWSHLFTSQVAPCGLHDADFDGSCQGCSPSLQMGSPDWTKHLEVSTYPRRHLRLAQDWGQRSQKRLELSTSAEANQAAGVKCIDADAWKRKFEPFLWFLWENVFPEFARQKEITRFLSWCIWCQENACCVKKVLRQPNLASTELDFLAFTSSTVTKKSRLYPFLSGLQTRPFQLLNYSTHCPPWHFFSGSSRANCGRDLHPLQQMIGTVRHSGDKSFARGGNLPLICSICFCYTSLFHRWPINVNPPNSLSKDLSFYCKGRWHRHVWFSDLLKSCRCFALQHRSLQSWSEKAFLV